MPSELLNVLLKRRSTVETKGEQFESAPEASSADAKAHLEGLSFNAPAAVEWLKQLDETPEEDNLVESIREGIADRGAQPAHAPRGLSAEDHARLKELAESLAVMQEQFESEREELGGAREVLERREAELQQREQALEAERQQQLRREEARKHYPPPEWLVNVEGTMNIGVTGNAGVGKSLLINKLRRIRPGADGWAAVGVSETTMRPTMYAFAEEPQMRLWDLPGAGTAAFPSEDYIQTMGLRYFDRIIIVSAGRFTSTELALQEELNTHGVPYVMVRTKADIDVWNNKEDNGMDENQTITQIVNDFKANGVNEAFVVSLRDPERFAMPALVKTLFPNVKTSVLDPSSPTFCPDVSEWNDSWAMPVVYSESLAGIQGQWRDAYGCLYLVQGTETHVTLKQGQYAVVPLTQSEGRVGWVGRWWLDMGHVRNARKTCELRWSPTDLKKDKPLIWWWVD